MAQTFWLLFTVSFLKKKPIPIYKHFVLYLQLLIELNSMKKYELQIIFMFLLFVACQARPKLLTYLYTLYI